MSKYRCICKNCGNRLDGYGVTYCSKCFKDRETKKNQDLHSKNDEIGNSSEKEKSAFLNWENRLRNEPEKLVRELLFEIKIQQKLKDYEIAEKIGVSKGYICYLKNSKTFKKYFPKKEKFQKKIVEKLIELRNAKPNNSKGVDKNEAETQN